MPRFPIVASLLPREACLLDHCRRVAALALAVAHHLFLETEEKDRLEAACLLHHYDLGLLEGAGAGRLLADLLEVPLPSADGGRVPPAIRAVLEAYAKPATGDPASRRLAEILRLADAFDQEYEAAPLEASDAGTILSRLRGGVEGSLWSVEYWHAFEQATLPVPLPSREAWRIPSFPRAAMRVLEMLRNPRTSAQQVEDAAGLDPAVAGRVMELANSALYGSRSCVATLRDAIGRLGFETSQRVVTGAAMRAVLAHPRLHHLWPHSIEIADLAAQLAELSGAVESGEAYLCGLIHDTGRLALDTVPLYDAARLQGFEQAGCPPAYAECILLRTDHSTLSGEIAASWKLPERLVEGVRRHHRPETSQERMAAVLYLAEYLTGGTEDLPSRYRLEWSLRSLQLSAAGLEGCQPSPFSAWLAA